ncbi:MAG: hypothetical protein M3010_03550 [Candidatus Dormibacteraeota bacterium]|nr:hypothetical protein [Candidatus Dormibacteraeota bacterium]
MRTGRSPVRAGLARAIAGVLGAVLWTVGLAPGSAVAATSTSTVPPGASSNPLSAFPAPPVATTSSATPTVVTNPSTGSSGASSLSSSTAIAIALGAVVVLGGISFFIWYDARRRAPVRRDSEAADLEGRGRTGSKPPPRQRKLSPAERRRRKRGRARR